MSNCRWVVISEDCYDQLRTQTTADNKTSDTTNTEDRKDTDVEEDWAKDLPPAYKAKAQEFINKLKATGSFDISQNGQVVLNQKTLNYSISEFLRTAFVPYNQTTFPIDVQEWLREQNMTTFPNPLAQLRPKWESAFTLRRSTRIKRAQR